MARHRPRSTIEILQGLGDQLGFLRDSAEAFDGGKRREARRIAGALYQLLHDDTNPKALTRGILTQAKIKTRIWYVSTAKPAEFHPNVRLASIQMAERVQLVPHCHIPDFSLETWPWVSHLPFAAWWEEPIYHHGGHPVTRKDLVLSVRNQDGGGHFNEEVRDRGFPYAEMVDEGDPSVTSGGKPLSDAHLVSLRQMAWEFETSFSRFGK